MVVTMQTETNLNSFEKPDTVVRKNRLTDHHADMVRKVARRLRARAGLLHQNTLVEEDDLFSVGMLGLFDAHKRFDPEEGTDFRAFAEFRVKGAMLDELRRRDRMPRRLRAKWRKVKRAEASLEADLGREATESEVARALGIELSKLAKIRRDISSHETVSTSVGIPMSSNLPSPESCFEAKERSEQLARALKSLPEREQLVLDLYFRRDLTLREIAEILGVSEGRVSQIKSASVKKLRHWFEERRAA